MSALLEIKDVSFSYGVKPALSDISVNVFKSNVVALLGKNGAGKSTLLKLIAGALTLQSGEIILDGYSLTKDPHRVKSRIGYLGEFPPLHDDVSVKDFLLFCGQLRGIEGAQLKQALEHTLNLTGLQDVYRKRIGNLSSGFRQRVGIAQAIIHTPTLLILDEPTAKLDSEQLAAFKEVIQSLQPSCAMVMATHRVQDITMLCDRILLLEQGCVILNEANEMILAKKKQKKSTQSDEALFESLLQTETV